MRHRRAQTAGGSERRVAGDLTTDDRRPTTDDRPSKSSQRSAVGDARSDSRSATTRRTRSRPSDRRRWRTSRAADNALAVTRRAGCPDRCTSVRCRVPHTAHDARHHRLPSTAGSWASQTPRSALGGRARGRRGAGLRMRGTGRVDRQLHAATLVGTRARPVLVRFREGSEMAQIAWFERPSAISASSSSSCALSVAWEIVVAVGVQSGDNVRSVPEPPPSTCEGCRRVRQDR